MQNLQNCLVRQSLKLRRHPRRLRRKAFNQLADGYLSPVGWLDSFHKNDAIDAMGGPIPWLTYSSIDFLDPRTHSNMSVFEFRSGNSTLWWANRAFDMVSCEHDADWHDRTRNRLPATVTYLFRKLEDNGTSTYVDALRQYRSKFHIVVFDGRNRVDCARNCIEALTDDGVVVFDDSHRQQYQPGLEFLIVQGFRRLDVSGLGAIGPLWNLTTVLYHRDNCLGI